MNGIAIISLVAIIICIFCLYSTIDTHLDKNSKKMNFFIGIIGISFLIFGSIFTSAVYFIFHPYQIDTYNKTTSNIEDGFKYFTDHDCKEFLFTITDKCIEVRKYKVEYKVVYGEPIPVALNSLKLD